MFDGFVAECVDRTGDELDAALRDNELALRRLIAERSALVRVGEQRGVFTAEHRSMSGYLRATVNTADASILRDRKLGALLDQFPEVGELLWAGHISIDHALQIARVHANPRVRDWLPVVIPVLSDLAEHSSYREFTLEVTGLIAKLDQDGAFDELKDSVELRRAKVAEVGGSIVISASGGDPIQAAQMQAIFDGFADREYRNDLDARRAEFGDDADQHPLPRTHQQRAFDALLAIFAAAHASPDGQALPEPVVNIVADQHHVHDALTHAGIILPGGDQIELDDDGNIDEAALLNDLAEELAAAPEAFLARRCETANGSPIHPSVVLRALLTGHVRRVVVDSRGVVVDYGIKQRLFTGLARQAAMLLRRTCEFPGCDLPADWSHVDHNTEWHQGGRTDQANSNIGCGTHNNVKHRERWKTRRNQRGRAYTIRADGTVILPAGERPPDLSIDEAREHTLARLANDRARLRRTA